MLMTDMLRNACKELQKTRYNVAGQKVQELLKIVDDFERKKFALGHELESLQAKYSALEKESRVLTQALLKFDPLSRTLDQDHKEVPKKVADDFRVGLSRVEGLCLDLEKWEHHAAMKKR